MYNAQTLNHIPFIMKPASDMIKEALSSLNATSGGIETYPICGYVLHSLFLKLTGAQEQKLKCICWELACRDYEYRYERFERNRFSECSDYKDKNTVYNDIIEAIQKLDCSFEVDDALRGEIYVEWQNTMSDLYEGSLMATSFTPSYNEYKTLVGSIKNDWYAYGRQLFRGKDNLRKNDLSKTCGLGLLELFKDYVYMERNRCAHNTRSYQHNLPSPRRMIAEDYKLQNYFLYMSVIVLLDIIYVRLFRIYLEIFE